MPHWPVFCSQKTVKLGLERMLFMLEAVDNPHLKIPPVIHVTGTNGKGSTIAYMKAIFESSGYSVHRYISPHLINFNERIMLRGREITDKMLFSIAEQCRVAIETLCDKHQVPYTFFEGSTVMAFLAFASTPADVVLLEVGMGGALDATNVIDRPALSIVTPISMDHTEFLGESLQLIAKEKAGIIKTNCPCIISWQYSEVAEVLKQYCKDVGAPYFAYGEQWDFFIEGDQFFVEINCEKNLILGPYKQSLIGIHQIINAATAVVSAFILSTTRYTNIGSHNITYGISHAIWHARMERIISGKLYRKIPPKWEMWLDGAHNPGGAEMLAASIRNLKPAIPLYIIHGRTARHNIEIFLEHFIGLNPKLICCIKVQSELRGESPEIIQVAANNLGLPAISCSSITEAVERCVEHSQKSHTNDHGARILICGSLYLAGDVAAAQNE